MTLSPKLRLDVLWQIGKRAMSLLSVQKRFGVQKFLNAIHFFGEWKAFTKGCIKVDSRLYSSWFSTRRKIFSCDWVCIFISMFQNQIQKNYLILGHFKNANAITCHYPSVACSTEKSRACHLNVYKFLTRITPNAIRSLIHFEHSRKWTMK